MRTHDPRAGTAPGRPAGEGAIHFVLCSFGTRGDVFPAIHIGRTLRLRGHRVTLLAAPGFAADVERAGLQFEPSMDPVDHLSSVRDMPLLLGRYRALYIRRYAVEWNRRLLAVLSRTPPDRTMSVCVDRPYLWADAVMQARCGVPALRLTTDLPSPRHWRPARIELQGGRVQAMLTAGIQSAWRRSMRAEGCDCGPAQIARLTGALMSRLPRIALWPRWVAPDPARAVPTRASGFILAPPVPAAAVPPARPRIIFVSGTTGTTSGWEERFLETSIALSAGLGLDGIMVGASETLAGRAMPAGFRCERFVPLAELLPGSTALVHHGGVGTCALALQHGIPQLILPRVFGQAINAEWMQRLGAGRVLDAWAYGSAGAGEIRAVMGNPAYRRCSETAAALIRPELDLFTVATLAEEHFRLSAGASQGRPRPRRFTP